MKTLELAPGGVATTALLRGGFLGFRGYAQPAADASVTGLWIYKMNYEVGLHGELSIARDKSGWRASIGGMSATGVANNREVRFLFAHNGGEFRGTLTADG